MSHVRRFDHVGLTVADLDVVTAFFVALGLEVEGRTFVEGEFLDTVCGIPDSRTEIVMLKPPDDGTRLELSSFVYRRAREVKPDDNRHVGGRATPRGQPTSDDETRPASTSPACAVACHRRPQHMVTLPGRLTPMPPGPPATHSVALRSRLRSSITHVHV